jgi:hypothetical protein
MNNDDSVKHVEPGSTSNTPPTSTSGKPVNVVERDLEDRESDTTDLDQSFTPSSIRTRDCRDRTQGGRW